MKRKAQKLTSILIKEVEIHIKSIDFSYNQDFIFELKEKIKSIFEHAYKISVIVKVITFFF